MSTPDSMVMELPVDRAGPGLLGLAERGWLPDALIRAGIRRLCERRLREEGADGQEAAAERFNSFLAQLKRSPLAIETAAANAQHYELPALFFQQVLGPRLKYSCAYYRSSSDSLAQAEDTMLALCAERAELADGQDILELGCGWGSMTLWMAEHYPGSRITAVSNSASQRKFIEQQCVDRGIRNVRVITQDVNRLELPESAYDRCVAIEILEHLRNYEELFHRMSLWLRADGKLFAHLFANRVLMYPFETKGEDNWLGRHFFTGGVMPAADTLLWFQRDLNIERVWRVPGTHYERTANDWLANHDRRRREVMQVMADTYGSEKAALWFQRWRIFWMACAELFGYDEGREWFVAHYRFGNRV